MEELAKKELRGISMEIIGAREIKVREEVSICWLYSLSILILYRTQWIHTCYNIDLQWEEAWNKHLVEWRPNTEDFGRYKSLHYINTRAPILELKEELDNAPYPDNIFSTCLYWEHDEYVDFTRDFVGDDQFQENEWNDKDLIETFSIQGHHFRVGTYNSFDETWWPLARYIDAIVKDPSQFESYNMILKM